MAAKMIVVPISLPARYARKLREIAPESGRRSIILREVLMAFLDGGDGRTTTGATTVGEMPLGFMRHG